MKYVITDGNSYIVHNQTGITSTGSIVLAQKFDYEKAYNVFKSIPKKLQKFKWILKEYKDEPKVEIIKDKSIQVEVDPVCQPDLPDNLNVLVKHLEDIQTELQEYIARREYLSNEESIVAKEIVDLEHFIEFGKFSASDGYKTTMMVQERLKRRRQLKDEIFSLFQIISVYPTAEKIVNARKSINGLDGRLYKPRVLQELFNK